MHCRMGLPSRLPVTGSATVMAFCIFAQCNYSSTASSLQSLQAAGQIKRTAWGGHALGQPQNCLGMCIDAVITGNCHRGMSPSGLGAA